MVKKSYLVNVKTKIQMQISNVSRIIQRFLGFIKNAPSARWAFFIE